MNSHIWSQLSHWSTQYFCCTAMHSKIIHKSNRVKL